VQEPERGVRPATGGHGDRNCSPPATRDPEGSPTPVEPELTPSTFVVLKAGCGLIAGIAVASVRYRLTQALASTVQGSRAERARCTWRLMGASRSHPATARWTDTRAPARSRVAHHASPAVASLDMSNTIGMMTAQGSEAAARRCGGDRAHAPGRGPRGRAPRSVSSRDAPPWAEPTDGAPRHHRVHSRHGQAAFAAGSDVAARTLDHRNLPSSGCVSDIPGPSSPCPPRPPPRRVDRSSASPTPGMPFTAERRA
jgi:hypothetical protein